MDAKSDVYPQWQLRSTSCLKGIKYNNHKKCPNRGRYCIKGKSAHPNSAKSKPAFEYNLDNFPRLDETNSFNKFANEKNNIKKMGATHGSIRIKNGSRTSTPERISDEFEYMDEVLSEKNESESENKKNNNTSERIHSLSQFSNCSNKQKENREVMRNCAVHESRNTMVVSPETVQDNVGFEVYKSKGHRVRHSSLSSDCARHSTGHRTRHSSVSSDRARLSSVSSDTSYVSKLSVAEVPDNWELRDSTASPGDLQPKDIKLPSRNNDNSLITDGQSSKYKKNVSQEIISTPNMSDFMDIELPYKPKPVKLTDQEKENLKNIRPKTYKNVSQEIISTSNMSDFMDIDLPYMPKPVKLTDQEKENLKNIRPKTYKNVSQDITSTPNVYDYMDIELPYKPKPVKLTDQEKENLKNIRPKTYKLYGFMTEEYSSESSKTTSISNICKKTANDNSKNIYFQDDRKSNELVSSKKNEVNSSKREPESSIEKKVSSKKNEVNSSKREPESSIEKKIMKSSANSSKNKNIQHISHSKHFDYNKCSVEYSSNSHIIKRIDLKNNEINKNETIGNDFLNHSSFLINNQKGPTKHLEDNSKNPRRNSSEFGSQRGYLSPSYHTWAPETFLRPSEWPRNLQSPNWIWKSFSPSSLPLDEEDYYFGNIPYDMDYPNGSDCESTSPRSLMSPLDDYTCSSSYSSSDATIPSSLADMFDIHPSNSAPCLRDSNKCNSPIANQILSADLGFVHYTGISHTEGSPSINSAISPPPMLNMLTQFQVPGATNLTPHPLPAVRSSSQLLESNLNLVTHENLSLYGESLISSKNSSRQKNEKKSWFDPIMVKGNIWA